MTLSYQDVMQMPDDTVKALFDRLQKAREATLDAYNKVGKQKS